ncbi:heterokaryon incompatibility protein-domain-containing protein, partial [Clohesyomyces aquaticus]
YCWGTSGQSKSVWCGNLKLNVTPNLKNGLRRLYKYSSSSRTEWFWIDQICINQEDKSERTQQVRLMRAIYQQAKNTVIWLGTADGTAEKALQLVSNIYRISLLDSAKPATPNNDSFAGNVSFSTVDSRLPPPDDERWVALAQLLARPWFERCWIIQEVVVSKDDPVMLYGDHEHLWLHFQKAILYLLEYQTNYQIDRMKFIHGISNLSFTQDLWELPALLHFTRPFQATDSKDKVFALLGLAGETVSPDEWPMELAPDYGRSLRDVYMDVTKYSIKRFQDLTILSQISENADGHSSEEYRIFPSWVPLWNLPQRVKALSAYNVIPNSKGWKKLVEKFNQASQELPVSIHSYTPSHILRLEGLRVSNVQLCLPAVSAGQSQSAKLSSSHSHPNALKQIPELYELCLKNLRHSNSQTLARTFFLVTTAGLTPENEDAHEEPLTHFNAFLQRMRSNTSETVDVQPHFRQNKPDPTRYTLALAPLLHRRLFITSSGHLGLGPANMMSGDTIVVLFGGRMLYVLRSFQDDQWKFIGECYVEGLMHGEALDDDKVKKETEQFDLV